MYTQYFGLTEKPFSITPDPSFLFLSERHAEALAHLVYGVTESGGFIQLTGEVGTGKTTLTRCLLDRLPDTVDLAVVLNPRLSVPEFLAAIFSELGITSPGREATTKELVDALNKYLLESHVNGRRTVLLVDEAQNLDSDVLEQLRLLTNLETSKEKLLQIILVGQPELRDTLARNDLRQLAQRITGRYHLENLNAEETIAYVKHRMEIAGNTDDVFEPAALWEIHSLTGGSPRLTNVLCDRALLGAYSSESKTVSRELLRKAFEEIHGARPVPPRRESGRRTTADTVLSTVPWRSAAAALAGLGLAGWIGWTLANRDIDSPQAQFPVTEQNSEETGALRNNNPRLSTNLSSSASRDTQSGTAYESQLSPNTNLKLDRRLGADGSGDATAFSEDEFVPLANLLNNPAINTSTDQSFRDLFGLWQRPTGFGSNAPCVWALQHQLRCEFLVGSKRLISAINRPAILSLVDDSGQVHNAVAVQLDDTSVVLRIADSEYRISNTDLSRYWYGEFLVLWQPRDGVAELLLPNTRSNGVAWLRAMLARLNDEPVPTPNSFYFDQNLMQRVTEFQRAHQLEADGIAGVQTLIALNTALRVSGTPLLRPYEQPLANSY
ncbi:MAG: AAA family ATPase [Gammaproteobacteria bacterium]